MKRFTESVLLLLLAAAPMIGAQAPGGATKERLLGRVHLQTAGCKPGVQFEPQPAGLDCGILISQGARLIHRFDLENEHASQVAVVTERTGYASLPSAAIFRIFARCPSWMRSVSGVLSAVHLGPR